MFLTCPLWTKRQHIILRINNALNRITQTALKQRSLTRLFTFTPACSAKKLASVRLTLHGMFFNQGLATKKPSRHSFFSNLLSCQRFCPVLKPPDLLKFILKSLGRSASISFIHLAYRCHSSAAGLRVSMSLHSKKLSPHTLQATLIFYTRLNAKNTER